MATISGHGNGRRVQIRDGEFARKAKARTDKKDATTRRFEEKVGAREKANPMSFCGQE